MLVYHGYAEIGVDPNVGLWRDVFRIVGGQGDSWPIFPPRSNAVEIVSFRSTAKVFLFLREFFLIECVLLNLAVVSAAE